MKITIVSNNVPHDERLETGWGFSAYIEGLEKNILFDTGDSGDVLLANMEKLGIDPENVDIVVLSHIHHDHTGGLADFLEKNKSCTIYVPEAFPDDFKSEAAKNCKEVISVIEPAEICKNAWSIGQLGTRIKEQSLVLESENGLIILTGCAHSGIVKIANHVKNILNKDIYLLIGGFHLEYTPAFMVKRIINNLKKLGVKKVAPSHCTGEKSTEMFKRSWGDDFVNLGCGANIRI
jgi:7,8-dihydropterin-6-yl-methyl-4-(beta-D-ribofuranosyl)aminobenzene 5'-phosphate synthase